MKDMKKIVLISVAFFVLIGAVVAVAVWGFGINGSDDYAEVITSSAVASDDETAKQSVDEAPYDLDAIANRAYELKYLFAVDSFSDPKELSVGKLVQYAFCHVFYDNLVDMPTSGIQLKQTTSKEINKVLKEHFNLTDVKITDSDLYNKKTKYFEMWQPNYGTSLFYTTRTKQQDEDTYSTMISYYKTAAKTESICTITAEVKKVGENYILQGMK